MCLSLPRASRILLQEWMKGSLTRLIDKNLVEWGNFFTPVTNKSTLSSLSILTSLPVFKERSLGLLRILSLICSSTLNSCCCCSCCSLSALQGVPHCTSEDDGMGKLGLGVPEAVLAEAMKAVLVRLHCSPAKLTVAAFVNAFGTVFNVPFGTVFGATVWIPLGIAPSWMYSCWFGLQLGESSPELELEPGLWLDGSGGLGVRGSRLELSWEKGAGLRQACWSWKGQSRCSNVGLVPETGSPRLRSCCRSSDTWWRRMTQVLAIVSFFCVFKIYKILSFHLHSFSYRQINQIWWEKLRLGNRVYVCGRVVCSPRDRLDILWQGSRRLHKIIVLTTKVKMKTSVS